MVGNIREYKLCYVLLLSGKSINKYIIQVTHIFKIILCPLSPEYVQHAYGVDHSHICTLILKYLALRS